MSGLLRVSLFLSFMVTVSSAQAGSSPSFREVVEDRLRTIYRAELSAICPIDDDPVANRVFWEYGAIFVSNNGGRLPTTCVFENESQVWEFQTAMNPSVRVFGGSTVTLQKPAMDALLAARQEALRHRRTITPRGGTVASTRSYSKTVELWRSRFEPGLQYWSARGKISRNEALAARKAGMAEQVRMVLEWEDKGLFFSRDLSKSILYSVAIPGASQHNFMLALDIQQFADKKVREILAKHGWFQTVKSDLPHFTFLGVAEKDLPSLGLTPVIVGGQKFWIPNL